MDWFDESHFPSKDDFANSPEYGEAIYSKILDRFSRKRGGTPQEERSKTAQAYSHLYALAKWNDELLISEDDIRYALTIPFDDPSDHVVSTHTDRISDILGDHGWFRANTSKFCFSGSKWSTDEFVYVYQKDENETSPPIIPGLESILDAIGTEHILSTTALSDYVRERLVNLEKRDEPAKEVVSAYVSAIETRLDEYEWVMLGAESSSERLWIDSDYMFQHLIDSFEGKTKISDLELQEKLENFIEIQSPKTKEGAAFNPEDFLEPLYRKIRMRDWNEVVYDDEIIWYKSKEDQRDALRADVNKYGRVLENPDDFSYEMRKVRQKSYKFFRDNQRSISNHGFYDRGFIKTRLRRLELHADVDEEWDRMDGSKTKDGIWRVIPNPEDDT